VAFVALLDARGLVLPPMSAVRSSLVRAVRWASWISFHAARPQPWKRIRAGAARRIRGALEGWRRGRTQLPASHAAAGRTALRQYRPQPWPGRILHVWAAERPHGPFRDAAFEWRHVAAQGFAFHEVPGDHLGFLREPNVAALARILAEELDRVAVAAR
jgi:thioesterase domain-containing protein